MLQLRLQQIQSDILDDIDTVLFLHAAKIFVEYILYLLYFTIREITILVSEYFGPIYCTVDPDGPVPTCSRCFG